MSASKKTMKFFITGSEGFVGKELVSQCKNKGIELFTADLLESHNSAHCQMDIRSEEIVSAMPEGVDAVIHLAGLTRDSDCKNRAYECFQANVMAVLNLIDAAMKKKAKQFIFASSEWVYGESRGAELKDENSPIDIMNLTSEYAFSKVVSEINLRQKYLHGFCPVTILRFGIIYGLRTSGWSAVEKIFNAVRTTGSIEVGSLKTGRCFIHVSDIAGGIIKSAGLKGFNTFNLAGDVLITLDDIIKTSAKILDKNTVVRESAPDNANIRNISSEKAKKMINWGPKINLEQGLDELRRFLSVKEGACVKNQK